MAEQSTKRPLRVLLWNNNPRDSEHYLRVISQFELHGALTGIEFHDSESNVGGMGRFIAMRGALDQGYTGPFVTMDDDQDFTEHFIDDLLAAYVPRSVSGVWAWNNTGEYWDRTQIVTTGESADYVGTGGAIIDSRIVAVPEFFSAIPLRFLFLEDIWLCRLANGNGWKLRMVESPVRFVLSEMDQGHAIFDTKPIFWRWLRDPANIPHVPSLSATATGPSAEGA